MVAVPLETITGLLITGAKTLRVHHSIDGDLLTRITIDALSFSTIFVGVSFLREASMPPVDHARFSRRYSGSTNRVLFSLATVALGTTNAVGSPPAALSGNGARGE